MKVILLKDLRKLGKEGDTVEVKDGYGRNYLIPCGAALLATNTSSKRLEDIKRQRTKIVEKEKQSFIGLKEKIENISLTITVQAKEDEELYGAISAAQIIKLLMAEGIDVDKNALILDDPIKRLGVYTLEVEVHPQVKAALRVWVVKK